MAAAHTCLEGSSPRMRGTLQPALYFRSTQGIIPAYAGNTQPVARAYPRLRDHPRVCGEHCCGRCDLGCWRGSSPRMRGTRTATGYYPRPNGIIPAYAGNTQGTGILPPCNRDHPRVCGEHPSRIFCELSVSGSSPRMRGTLGFHVIVFHNAGIIPAYAGNTQMSAITGLPMRDHPRVCGEHMSRRSVQPRWGGSSPRMRGTLSVA